MCCPLRTVRLRCAQVIVVVLPGVVLPAVVVVQRELEPMVECWHSLHCCVVILQDLLGRQLPLLPGCLVPGLLVGAWSSARR